MFKDTQTNITEKFAIFYCHKADLKYGAKALRKQFLYFRKRS
jgi:hypothetical protein